MRFGGENTQRGLTSSDALVRRRVPRRTSRSVDEEPCALPEAALSAEEEEDQNKAAGEKARRSATHDDERPATAEALHNVQTEEGAAKVDGAEDDLRDEGVDGADGLEDGRAIWGRGAEKASAMCVKLAGPSSITTHSRRSSSKREQKKSQHNAGRMQGRRGRDQP